MQIIITYSFDLNKPLCDWTTEFYDTPKEARDAAMDLLYNGFYVRLDEEDNDD